MTGASVPVRPVSGAGWGPSGGGAVLAPTLLGRGGEPGLTAAFVERAFAFPVRVRAEPGPGGAVRLTLAVVPRYLPAAGAVAVRASVVALDDRGQPVGLPADVAFVVRYERPERGPLRYAVGGTPTGAPWATAPAVGGGLRGLAVRVGQGWAAAPPADPDVARPDATAVAASPALGSGGLVPAASRLALGPEGRTALADALGAGRFTVSGSAYFRVGAPFTPPSLDPTHGEIAADGRPTGPGVAREQFSRTFGAAPSAGTAAPRR